MPEHPTPNVTVLRPPTRAALAEAIAQGWAEGQTILPIDPAVSQGEADRILEAAGGTEPRPDTRLVLPTAGSTGEPKLVELSEGALWSAAQAAGKRLGSEEGDVWLCCLPLHHIAGAGIISRSVALNSPALVHESFDPRSVADSGADYVSLVPTMLFRLLEEGIDLSGFKAILLGGARISPTLLARARDGGANVVTTYGMTETCGGVVYDGVPLDGVRVELDTDGTIRIGGPTLMSGYLGRPALTVSALTDGWFRTSDIGSFDPEGRLEVLGRADDVIITGGENVQPAEIEALLESHPDVAEALVVGEPDQEWGSRVVALVVARREVPAEALRDLVAEGAAPFKVPKEIRFVDALPRLATGKVDRRSATG